MNTINFPSNELESSIFLRGELPAGVDEAGRGPLAGPVCAAAVVFSKDTIENTDFLSIGINDSKKLSEKARKSLVEIIKQSALAWSYSFVDNETIDKINILQASVTAMNNAVNKLEVKPDFLLIDGNYFKGSSIPFRTIIGGDAKSIIIAAASILAKTIRDEWMIKEAHNFFPDYGFDKHKGYATKQHFEAIKKYGICPLHRVSFLQKFAEREVSAINDSGYRLFT